MSLTPHCCLELMTSQLWPWLEYYCHYSWKLFQSEGWTAAVVRTWWRSSAALECWEFWVVPPEWWPTFLKPLYLLKEGALVQDCRTGVSAEWTVFGPVENNGIICESQLIANGKGVIFVKWGYCWFLSIYKNFIIVKLNNKLIIKHAYVIIIHHKYKQGTFSCH